MNYHINATTNKVQRQEIQKSNYSITQLSNKYEVTKKTIRKWKNRNSQKDRSSRPHTIHYALNKGEQEIVVILRKLTWAPAYSIVDAVENIIPKANRSNVSRTLQRHSVSKRPQEKRSYRKFKDYKPGYIHIDVTYIPQLEGRKKYLFVAIDRATRLMYVELRDTKSMKDSTAFLRKVKRFFPFKIEKVLTDNGAEFTNKRYGRNGRGNVKKVHKFTQECNNSNIEHRTTKIKSPWTNGMVERANGLIKDNTLKVHIYNSYKEMNKDFKGFEMRYNVLRKHGSLQRKTPYEQLLLMYEKYEDLFWQKPDDWLSSHYKGITW
jgi:transposase-like protein